MPSVTGGLFLWPMCGKDMPCHTWAIHLFQPYQNQIIMERVQYRIDINAPAQNVWNILWGSDTYPQWTRPFSESFNEDSRAITDWQEDSKVQFVNSKGDGMFGVIEQRVDNELMAIHHLGEVKGGVEQAESEWGDAYEIYNLESNKGGTTLTVDLDTVEQFKGFFDETFPKALNIVKEMSESL